jgi:diguanylate cyclase (GGDEF)-like protein
VLDQRRALYFPDIAEEPQLASQLSDPAVRSGAVIPLATGGENFGFLEAWNSEPGAFTDDDLGLLALLATLAGGLIKNARRLERLIFVDPLTGVHTRGYFDEEFRREIERSNRTGASLALLMIDLDEFKKVNDTYRHAAGDTALRSIAQLLKTHVRQIDIVTRYGGEEFAVLLPGASVEEATRAAERLRATSESTPVAIDETLSLQVTLSVGVALYPDHAKTREELLAHGDEALYEAKDLGRNRVVVWSPELEEKRRRS